MSLWSVTVVIVSRKLRKERFCVDYQDINQGTKTDNWPLQNIEDMFYELEGRKYFPTLDLFSGHLPVCISEELKEKTTFLSRFGKYKFEVMPCGLMNALYTFQRMRHYILRDYEFRRVYLDDMDIFYKDLRRK